MAHFLKWSCLLILSRSGRKFKNYKSSGNSQSQKLQNFAVILGKILKTFNM